jgi:hypothetical protein
MIELIIIITTTEYLVLFIILKITNKNMYGDNINLIINHLFFFHTILFKIEKEKKKNRRALRYVFLP